MWSLEKKLHWYQLRAKKRSEKLRSFTMNTFAVKCEHITYNMKISRKQIYYSPLYTLSPESQGTPCKYHGIKKVWTLIHCCTTRPWSTAVSRDLDPLLYWENMLSFTPLLVAKTSCVTWLCPARTEDCIWLLHSCTQHSIINYLSLADPVKCNQFHFICRLSWEQLIISSVNLV